MSNDIDGVDQGLVEITESLKAIRKNSGRSVKVGISTFGAPGRENLELPLEGNLVVVGDKLKELLKNYSILTHSTDPGEASYHGLKLVADKFEWHSRNRMVILITDEEAYELTSVATDKPT